MRRNTQEVIKSNRNFVLLCVVLFLSLLLTIPILSTIRSHPDEHQFYFNAFSIMAGQALHNYLHVALTEYALAAFFLVVNMFTDSGVNFPQGDPTLVTFFYGKVFGFLLYLITFVLGVLILQRDDRSIKIRSVIYAILYFGSLGMFERFLRVNSDSMSIFVYVNFVILSFWAHKRKKSVIWFFVLNTIFVFLGTFTNLKSLFLLAPVVLLNVVLPFFVYEREKNDNTQKLPVLYKLLLFVFGLVVGCILLWALLAPKPFDHHRFWYGVKKTIIHGTQFDFDYPSQAYDSWEVYLYDVLINQIGLSELLAIAILLVFAYKYAGKELFFKLWQLAKNQASFSHIKNGDLYQLTELVLFCSMFLYYLGVSTRVIHWSRWGAPAGFLAIMLLSTGVESLVVILAPFADRIRPKPVILAGLLFLTAWVLRIFLTIDLARSNYPELDGHKMTDQVILDFLKKRSISLEDAPKKVAWIEGNTSYVGGFQLDQIVDEEHKDVEYLLWPYWHLGHFYNRLANVNKGMSNQIEFFKKYVSSVKYGFPNLLSYYAHFTKWFAWRVLGITWNPEIDNLIENQFAILKLKGPMRSLTFLYDVGFSDLSHYKSIYSRTFNMKTLTDTYMLPPCYSYPDARFVKSGGWVRPPAEFGVGGRTAGRYCHSLRLVYLYEGKYRIRISGLPDNPDDKQIVYSNVSAFDWDPETKTITIDVPNLLIPGEFGVATKEEYIKDLKFTVFYVR